MIRLLTLTCVLALGKIVGQTQTVVSQYLDTQALSILSPPVSLNRRFLAPPQPRLQNLSPQLFLPNTGSDLPPQTVRENQLRRQLFIPPRAEEMNRNRPLIRNASDKSKTVSNSTGVRPSDVYDNVSFQEKESTGRDTNVDRRPVNVEKSAPPIILSQPGVTREKPGVTPEKPGVTPEKPGVTREKPGNSSNQLNVTEVTLDQRASFDGDKCPSGYIRINGSNECIQPD